MKKNSTEFPARAVKNVSLQNTRLLSVSGLLLRNSSDAISDFWHNLIDI